ncbi:hypothetical protein SCP_0901370 [Sparassis crispa]|uniref:Uncharacterized protein n=1 Tax=Sparassis crispa TaxID=139825 RepID=A0A401GVK6_9APHY|nr:hypothetical protein SCP_0901370 [Sparassis crispa]GBE86258.1 hypothetical protein SCP_0901370 [Sparassis crispa]
MINSDAGTQNSFSPRRTPLGHAVPLLAFGLSHLSHCTSAVSAPLNDLCVLPGREPIAPTILAGEILMRSIIFR